MRYVIATVVAAALLPAMAAATNVYRSIDAQGHVHYSDTPSPGAQLIRVDTDIGPEATTPATASASSTSSDSGSQSSDADQQIARQQAERAVQQEESQKRSAECKQAQDAYQQSMNARRLYRTGADGQRQYLSDTDADKVRVDQRLQMQQVCKGQ